MGRAYLIVITLLLSLSSSALAASDADADGKPITVPSTTQGTVSVEGRSINYTAEAGMLILKDAEGSPTARMSYVAYFADRGKSSSNRPITFFYNGGPGSSSIWLHMGAFGPRRAVVGDGVHTPPPSYQLVNNDYSLLDATDMVFVDAVGTGFGRILDKDDGGKGEPKDFYGVDQDATAFTQFITQFLSEHQRWNSPKYLFGESYGTTRSAVLAYDLENNASVDLNGVILLSAFLNLNIYGDFLNFNPGSDLSYALMLPSFASTAWYHHKLPTQPAELQPFLREVEKFAMGDYRSALQSGSTLDPETKRQVADRMHEYTGLPVDYLLEANLQVTGPQFEQTLLGDSGHVTGRYDTRYTGPTMDPLAETASYDPQDAGIDSPIVSLFNDYVRRDLKFGANLTYLPTDDGIVENWEFKHQPPGAAFPLPFSTNVLPDLAAAMIRNPNLKVMLNSGYYDLATPYYGAVYMMHQLPMPVSLQQNITYAFYSSGHMVYVNAESLKRLHDNVAKFIDASHR